MRTVVSRAILLAKMADECMRSGCTASDLPDGCISFRAALWPLNEPSEVRFAAVWPGITLVCSRSLAGYSLEGGLHRE